ncbi:MAG: ribitol-5-phosphate dehydrogenase, partial [Oscillospiraceae bacterium]
PQGTVMLMGVSENKVPINTRNILEKGLTFVGSSRSGRVDFEMAVSMMSDPVFQSRLSVIISEDEPANDIKDIQRIFANDLNTPFKTVFKWNI